MDNAKKLLKALQTCKIKNNLSQVRLEGEEVVCAVEKEKLLEVVEFIKQEKNIEMHQLIGICGVDYPAEMERFQVVYFFLSMTKNTRMRIITKTAEGREVPSLVALHPAAGWYEREVFDLFGIEFANHPDMRRILTDYDFSGHPLRKDFPVTGEVEVRYDGEKVVYEPVLLTQEFRNFDFTSPWSGYLPGDEKASKL